MMRIVTGRARGTHLATPEGDETRPTAERTKEAVFSVLYTDVADRRVLDLFAGSGQLALEAVSRGAASAVLVESSPEAAKVTAENIRRTHFEAECRLERRDAAEFLKTTAETFNLVFLDPPYRLHLIPKTLELMLRRGILMSDALIIAETENEADVFGGDLDLASHFRVTRRARYGKAAVTFLAVRGE